MVPRLFVLAGGTLLGILLINACSGPESAPSSEDASSRVYHVHLQLTEEKTQAAETLGQALRWWKQQPSAQRPPLAPSAHSSSRPVTIKWRPPFYRVRLGPFDTKRQAERVVETAASRFPDAFVAPGRTAPAS